jgi:uncharacterized protein YggU (UPF0235/DUF167 family)
MGGIRRWTGRHGATDPEGRPRRRGGIEHLSDGRCVLKARVRVAPSDGEANSALQRLLAQTLGVAPREVVLVSGAASRIKRMLIRGDTSAVAAALEHIGDTSVK